jgi:hypothetical protein
LINSLDGDARILAGASFIIIRSRDLSFSRFSIAEGEKDEPIVIDFILAIGLIQLRAGARDFTLFRTGVGAILWPIMLFAKGDLTTAIVASVIQWGYCGSIMLLLTGRTKTWRLALAVGIFVVFVLGIYSVLLLLVVLAQLAGL